MVTTSTWMSANIYGILIHVSQATHFLINLTREETPFLITTFTNKHTKRIQKTKHYGHWCDTWLRAMFPFYLPPTLSKAVSTDLKTRRKNWTKSWTWSITKLARPIILLCLLRFCLFSCFSCSNFYFSWMLVKGTIKKKKILTY